MTIPEKLAQLQQQAQALGLQAKLWNPIVLVVTESVEDKAAQDLPIAADPVPENAP